MTQNDDNEELLTPQEVAQMFRVDPKTVTRWAKDGKISCLRTLGGVRRYRAKEIRALLSDNDREHANKNAQPPRR